MLHLFLRYRQTFLPFSDAKVRIFADTGKKKAFYLFFAHTLHEHSSFSAIEKAADSKEEDEQGDGVSPGMADA